MGPLPLVEYYSSNIIRRVSSPAFAVVGALPISCLLVEHDPFPKTGIHPGSSPGQLFRDHALRETRGDPPPKGRMNDDRAQPSRGCSRVAASGNKPDDHTSIEQRSS